MVSESQGALGWIRVVSPNYLKGEGGAKAKPAYDDEMLAEMLGYIEAKGLDKSLSP